MNKQCIYIYIFQNIIYRNKLYKCVGCETKHYVFAGCYVSVEAEPS